MTLQGGSEYNYSIANDGKCPNQVSSAELLQWSVVRSEAEVCVALQGEIDLSTAGALGDLLATVVSEQPRRIVVDMVRVSFMDSTGINVLLGAMTSAARVDCTLVVRHANRTIRSALTICGVADVLLDDHDRDLPAGR